MFVPGGVAWAAPRFQEAPGIADDTRSGASEAERTRHPFREQPHSHLESSKKRVDVMIRRLLFGLFGLIVVVRGPQPPQPSLPRVDFNRDIQIRSCRTIAFTVTARTKANPKAGLRLDQRKHATIPAESGEVAIVAGKPDASELIRRVISNDPETHDAASVVEKVCRFPKSRRNCSHA